MQDDQKTCTKCGKDKPVGEFYWRTQRGNFQPFQPCKDCSKAQNNERYRTDEAHAERGRVRARTQSQRRIEDPEFRQHCLERERLWRDANRDRVRQYARSRALKYPNRLSEQHRMKRYGITTEQLEARIQAQGGTCLICPTPVTIKDHIDHLHGTKVIRGVLCGRCNQGIGLFKEDPTRLRAAATYLEATRQDKIESDLGRNAEKPTETIGSALSGE